MAAGLAAVAGLGLFFLTQDARSGEACCAGKGGGGASALAAIKQLAGEWVQVGEDGKPTDFVMTKFRVTAAGSAVEETLFPGTDHEMITMYHTDGDALVLTHYCGMGNQPRMKAEPSGDPKKIAFKFTGGTNIKPESDMHMHDGTITLVDANRIKAEWSVYDGGKQTLTHTFDVMRK